MKQKPSQHRLGDFMEGKGFYIVLFLCVAAIGISGYYLFSGLFGQSGEAMSEVMSPVSGQVQQEEPVVTLQPKPQAPVGQETMNRKEETKAGDTAPEKKKEDLAPDEKKANAVSFVWPVEGEIERDFSLEVFAYDPTMGDWRTHDGLDIAADIGAEVCACARGTVSEVTKDPMMGTCVTVDHGNGIVSTYANLSESVSVREGDTVEAGMPLGTVGTTAISESAGASHLHFAMSEYDVSIDPMHYLH